MSELIDEVGNRYGRLVVLEREMSGADGKAVWLCQCDCGEQTIVRGCDLKTGNTKSCGCRRAGLTDEAGNRYGRLTVLRRVDNKGDNAAWLCRCECGNEPVVLGKALRSGNTKSCGCSRIRYYLPRGLASARRLLRQYRRSARRRGYAWELTEEQFLDLTSKPCSYCGIGPKQEVGGKGENGTYIYNGIDRKDSAVGYALENCVPCCKQCNYAKGIMGLSEFLEWTTRVYHHSRHK